MPQCPTSLLMPAPVTSLLLAYNSKFHTHTRVHTRVLCSVFNFLTGRFLFCVRQVLLTMPMVAALFPVDAAASIMDGSLLAAKQTDYLSFVQVRRMTGASATPAVVLPASIAHQSLHHNTCHDVRCLLIGRCVSAACSVPHCTALPPHALHTLCGSAPCSSVPHVL